MATLKIENERVTNELSFKTKELNKICESISRFESEIRIKQKEFDDYKAEQLRTVDFKTQQVVALQLERDELAHSFNESLRYES
jgi:hypothetical protein